MIKELISRSKEYLDEFYTQLDPHQIETILGLCLQAKGHVFLSGIGKSGFIAKKIAMTLVSCGTKSLFLDPLNLLHGDLGIVDEGDVIIVMSKSGHTKELIEMVPYIKKQGAIVIACVSAKDSPLEKVADVAIYLPVVAELDDHNLVPTTSTQVQLIFGDILTMGVMKSKGIGLDRYATYHPAGSIGKKLLTKVEEIMLPESQVPFCHPDVFIKDILVELTSKKCGCVVVSDDKKAIKGIFTDGDLRRSLQNLGVEALDMPVSSLMSAKPFCISKDITAFEAKKAMQTDSQTWINVLPIVEGEQVIGLLRLHDILKAGI